MSEARRHPDFRFFVEPAKGFVPSKPARPSAGIVGFASRVLGRKERRGRRPPAPEGPRARTVFAVLVGSGKASRTVEGLGAIYNRENSPVAWTSVSAEYLSVCEEVSEAEARAIHPALFKNLDGELGIM